MKDAVSYRKFVVPEMIFGNGCLTLVDGYARCFGLKNILVVSDPGVCSAGWTDKVITCLKASGISSALFVEITPNPKDYEVMAGAAVYQSNRCDGIIAVGGGSPMDCAKGIAIVVSNGGHILQYEGVDRIPYPMPPLICIPTTAGTAADISQFAIITDTPGKCKIAIISKTLVPDLALIDPRTTSTMGSDMTACSGMDALVHAIEAYVSTASSVFTDLQALNAIALVAEHLPAVMSDLSNQDARRGMMLASTEAGMAFSNASLGAVHAMAHSLGGVLDSPHGDCNALLLEHVVRYNFASASERYRRVAEKLGCSISETVDDHHVCTVLTDSIRRLRIESGIVGSLSDRGVTMEMIPQLAHKAMNDPCMITNPRRPSVSEIEELYVQAL